MNSSTQRTYDQVFQHPMTHNLEWRDVRALFESIGEVEDEHNGNIKVTLNGQAVVFQSPNNSKVASPDEVSQIRHLLESSGKAKSKDTESHFLLVIDHQEARIFKTELKGSVPESIAPFDPDGTKSHVHPNVREDSGHNEQPKHDAYFGQIAKALKGVDQILIFGSGQGASSAMNQFVAWLGDHHHSAAEHIIGTIVVDQSHLSEGELLAKAREIYAQS